MLVVDDDEASRRMTARLLEAGGFRCLEADGAERALALLGAERPDAMLLDLVLGPDNGWEVLRRALEAVPALPVLLVTGGDVDADTEADARAIGARGILRKPFEPARLLAATADLLKEDAA